MGAAAVERHCRVLESLNQRGGRMLSVVDLLDAGTLNPELAAHLLARIGAGASFMIGAQPQAAGKTTVMAALLNFVPAERELVVADGPAAIAAGLKRAGPVRCHVCHELGSGPVRGYLWDGALRSYFELARAGHQLATNLHADTLEAAREQVCGVNGTPAADFRRMHLVILLRVRGEARTVHEVWEADGRAAHLLVWSAGRLASGASPAGHGRARAVLDRLLASRARSIREVRAFVVDASG